MKCSFLHLQPSNTTPQSTSTSRHGIFNGLADLRRAEREVYRQAFDVTRMSRVRIVSNCFRLVCRRHFAAHEAVNRAWSRFAN